MHPIQKVRNIYQEYPPQFWLLIIATLLAVVERDRNQSGSVVLPKTLTGWLTNYLRSRKAAAPDQLASIASALVRVACSHVGIQPPVTETVRAQYIAPRRKAPRNVDPSGAGGIGHEIHFRLCRTGWFTR